MKRLIALGVVLFLLSCSAATNLKHGTTPTQLYKLSGCHARDNEQLPDPQCTPGVIDHKVTQENIHSTICVPGYSAKVRPSENLTNRLKHAQIILYGYADTNLSDYEEDHLISLELGGAPADPKNLWPEHHPSPNPKDAIENALHRLVCKGKMTLATAQYKISKNWMIALVGLVRKG